MSRPPQNQVGEVVGELKLIEYTPGSSSPRTKGKWLCECSCGQVAVITTDNLRQGRSRTCGHAQGARRTCGQAQGARRAPPKHLPDHPLVVKGEGLRAHHVRAAALTAHLGPWAALGATNG